MARDQVTTRSLEAGGRDRPIWPTVLAGVIMVVAALGILRSLGMLLGVFLALMAKAIYEGSSLAGLILSRFWTFAAEDRYWRLQVYHLYFMFVPPLPQIVSLIGGALLLKRRPSAGLWCVIGAAATIVALVAGCATNIWAYWPVTPGWAVADVAIPNSIVALVGMILPIFVIVWFSRAKIRRQVRQWRPGRTCPPAPRGDVPPPIPR